jgi:methionine synthase I (cobalamin-dependent)
MYKLTELMTLKIIGGCCGTDNTHIGKIASTFAAIK